METNKVILNGRTLVDLTEDTALTNDVAQGKTFHTADGVQREGTLTLQDKTVNPSTSSQQITADEGKFGLGTVTINPVTSSIDSNITQNNIRSGVSILGVQGNLQPDKPDQTKTVNPTTSQQVIQPDTGYELASVTVNAVTSSIDANIISSNIKKNVTILGVTGNLEGDKPDQNKTVSPTTSQQVITPDSGYELASVTVTVTLLPTTA